jgi:DNA-binding Lrp family transcriptional regulator
MAGARKEREMNETNLLLNAYYEALYEKLEADKELLTARVEKLLREEIVKRGFGSFDEEKYAAYRDACLAFVDERLETYNPIGIQYTFDRIRAKEAVELELQLNWYDNQTEFKALLEAVRAKAEVEMTEEKMRELAEELIKEAGAFPDGSIISAYEAAPALGKLPDYIVARAIEETIK